jgi:hypothetical protein
METSINVKEINTKTVPRNAKIKDDFRCFLNSTPDKYTMIPNKKALIKRAKKSGSMLKI